MELKHVTAIAGIGLTAISGSFGWAVNISREVSTNESNIIQLQSNVSELKLSIHEVYKQNVEIDNKLTDILHKQDKRLEMLEYQVNTDKKVKK